MGGPPPGRLVLRPPFGVGQAPRDTGAPRWCRPLPRGACLWKSLGPLLERGREACEPLSGASGTEVRLGAGHRGPRESPWGRCSSCALRSVWRVGSSPPSPFTARPPLAQPAATSVPLSGSECASSRGPARVASFSICPLCLPFARTVLSRFVPAVLDTNGALAVAAPAAFPGAAREQTRERSPARPLGPASPESPAAQLLASPGPRLDAEAPRGPPGRSPPWVLPLCFPWPVSDASPSSVKWLVGTDSLRPDYTGFPQPAQSLALVSRTDQGQAGEGRFSGYDFFIY